jgi:hypothetical protein
MSPTLRDLEVVTWRTPWAQTLRRNATLADLVEVAESLGGEVETAYYDEDEPRAYGVIEVSKPGDYLIVPLDGLTRSSE